MRLEFVVGPGRFAVATYDESTATFVADPAGSGLIEIADNPSFSLAFVDYTASLTAAAGALHSSCFEASGSTGDNSSPRIEFWVDKQRVASFNSDGKLTVVDITEQAAAPGEGLFELKLGGVLFATIGRSGLICPFIEEP